MKKFIVYFLMMLVSSIIFAQPKPVVKPVTPATPAKPKVSPYVLKKDYEEMLLNMESKVKSATELSNNLRRDIGGKDKKIATLTEQMAKVEEILNSTAFKISTAEDSLSKTRFSVEVFRNETQEKFTQLDTQIAEAKNNSNMMFYIALGLSIIMFVLLLIQNGKLKKSMLSHTIQSEIKVKEAISKMEEDLNTQQKYSSNEINNVKLQLLKEFKLENITINTKIETLINTLEDLKNNK